MVSEVRAESADARVGWACYIGANREPDMA